MNNLLRPFKISFIACFLSLPLLILAQSKDSGTIKNGTKTYIEVLPGNMPLVISIPHGGYLLPDEIPERPCTNCAKHPDIFTILDAKRAFFKSLRSNDFSLFDFF